jgi:hypothetical protein
MRSRWLVMLLVSSAAACASAPRAGETTSPAPDVPPIPALVGERERLGLSAAQVGALDSIARAWSATDAALHRRLGVERGRRPVPVALGLHPSAGPARSALHDNTLRALHAVEQVLTPEQRRAACAPPRGAEGGRDHAAKLQRAWTWCAGATASTRSGSAAPTRPWR